MARIECGDSPRPRQRKFSEQQPAGFPMASRAQGGAGAGLQSRPSAGHPDQSRLLRGGLHREPPGAVPAVVTEELGWAAQVKPEGSGRAAGGCTRGDPRRVLLGPGRLRPLRAPPGEVLPAGRGRGAEGDPGRLRLTPGSAGIRGAPVGVMEADFWPVVMDRVIAETDRAVRGSRSGPRPAAKSATELETLRARLASVRSRPWRARCAQAPSPRGDPLGAGPSPSG